MTVINAAIEPSDGRHTREAHLTLPPAESMFNYSLKIATAACLIGSAALGVVSPAPAEASTIGVCNASTIGRTSQIQQVIEKSAPGSSSSGREFTNSWTFVAPDGYMISSVNVKKLKGGSNTSYSEKWLPSGGSFSSRTQFNNAYSESLNLLAQYRGSQGYERASLDYQNKESQMSNWYNQVNSGQQGSYEFKMSVRPNSASQGLWDMWQDVTGRFEVNISLRCIGSADAQRTYYRNLANKLIRQYGLKRSPGGQQPGGSNNPGQPQPPAQPTERLDGWWRGDRSGLYSIQTSGSDFQMKGFSSDGSALSLFTGTIHGNRISGSWKNFCDNRTGSAILEFSNGQVRRISGATANSQWSRSVRPGNIQATPRCSQNTPGQAQPPAAINLNGSWRANDGGSYIIRQTGNSISWQGSGGNFRNTFNGQINGNLIRGYWQDTANSQTQNSGQLTLRVENGNRLVRVSHTGAFTGSTWEKLQMQPH